MDLVDDVRAVVATALDLGARGEQMDASAPLLGALPELDSMAVMNVIVAIEERFDIAIDDDDINASTFATLGSLARFVESKVADQTPLNGNESTSSAVNA